MWPKAKAREFQSADAALGRRSSTLLARFSALLAHSGAAFQSGCAAGHTFAWRALSLCL
jgi:hypothetical protein